MSVKIITVSDKLLLFIKKKNPNKTNQTYKVIDCFLLVFYQLWLRSYSSPVYTALTSQDLQNVIGLRPTTCCPFWTESIWSWKHPRRKCTHPCLYRNRNSNNFRSCKLQVQLTEMSPDLSSLSACWWWDQSTSPRTHTQLDKGQRWVHYTSLLLSCRKESRAPLFNMQAQHCQSKMADQ